MMLLTREAIVQAQDLKSEDVAVPEWGGSVRVRMLTGTERDALGRSMFGADGKPSMAGYDVKLVARCMIGEDGLPLFGPDEVEQLGTKSAAALTRVYEVAERINSMSSASVEAAQGN